MRSDLQKHLSTPSLLLRHAAEPGAVLGILGSMDLNLRGYPFPGWSTAESRRAVADKILPVLHDHPRYKWTFCAEMSELSLEERYLLLERGQITPPIAARQDGVYVLLNDTRDTECYINDEEHLHIQTFYPGKEDNLTHVESELADLRASLLQKLPVACDKRFGYISYDPGKSGAGLFFALLVFLPGLRMSKLMPQVWNAFDELGVYGSGLFPYQKGDESDLWLLHTPASPLIQKDLLLHDMHVVLNGVDKQEMISRDKLVRSASSRARLQKKVLAACRDLTESTKMTYKRELEALSMLRLGMHYGWVEASEDAPAALADAYCATAPMFLTYHDGITTKEGRLKARAAYLKDCVERRLQLTYHI